MDTLSESRLRDIHPVLASKVRTLAAQLAAQGVQIRVVQGWRTFAAQDALYAQGRTSGGKIVTNCPGGHSYHNYGLAVDLVPMVKGVAGGDLPDWNASHPTWKRMIDAGRALGLTCGADWRTFPDLPHFQLTGVLPPGHPPESLIAVYGNGNLKAAWDAAKIEG